MKFLKFEKALLIKWLLLPSLLLVPALARTDTPNDPEIARFSVFCINNTTDYALNYQVKWGEDGLWQEYTVDAYGGYWHSWEYTVPGSIDSPTPYIYFDSDMSDGTSWVEYYLEPFAAPDAGCEFGKNYQFEWDGGSTRYIDLLAI